LMFSTQQIDPDTHYGKTIQTTFWSRKRELTFCDYLSKLAF
jgi:hypothetical protein